MGAEADGNVNGRKRNGICALEGKILEKFVQKENGRGGIQTEAQGVLGLNSGI